MCSPRMVRRDESYIFTRIMWRLLRIWIAKDLRILATCSILFITAEHFDNHFRVAVVDFKLGDN